MTDLIACLGTGEAHHRYVQALIAGQDWDNVFLIASAEAAQSFAAQGQVHFVIVDAAHKLLHISAAVQKQLSGKLNTLDVALNLSAGSGKESMAVLAALLKLGAWIRLIAYTKETGVQEL